MLSFLSWQQHRHFSSRNQGNKRVNCSQTATDLLHPYVSITAACSNSTPPQMSQRALLQFPLLPFLEHKPLMHQWRETHVLSTLLVCPSKRSRRRGFYKDHSEFFRRGKLSLYLYSKLLSLNGG